MDFSRLIFFLSRVVAKRRSVSEGLYPSWQQSARGLCEKRSRARPAQGSSHSHCASDGLRGDEGRMGFLCSSGEEPGV